VWDLRGGRDGGMLTAWQVAQLIPLPAMDKQIRELNVAIPAWAAWHNSTQSPIWVVDQWTGFTEADLKDGIHPAPSGDVKIAERFYPALVGAIQSSGDEPASQA